MAKVTGLKNICVHVLSLEKTLELYREVLGFKLVKADVLQGENIEGMLVLNLLAGDCLIHLSLTAPDFNHTIGEVGNTNHNHFMLYVDDIGAIGDELVTKSYVLENMNYREDKHTFFTGPNSEIIGLCQA